MFQDVLHNPLGRESKQRRLYEQNNLLLNTMASVQRYLGDDSWQAARICKAIPIFTVYYLRCYTIKK